MLPWPQTLGVGTLYINTVTRRWMALQSARNAAPGPQPVRFLHGEHEPPRAWGVRPGYEVTSAHSAGNPEGGKSTRTAGSGAGARDPGGVFLGVIINAY